MKRAAVILLATTGLLLLGGCVPVWDDGGYGRDHYRHYDHDRRYYDQGDDNDQGRGRRYDGRRYDRYQGRDRDDRDD
ncbi:hypothetical protein [Pseudomonas palleroniana]|uniref:hypothetical protein n=1 Tax=Pseudomonas palleroniana TaxID=191390 RepID=UPI0018E6CC4A|nr:hypothetical protein [Pseudomonas palleroniana]MBI6910212.1 hypothetical protein [Pseudomonas palleroniana]